jgi:hypothetical protein
MTIDQIRYIMHKLWFKCISRIGAFARRFRDYYVCFRHNEANLYAYVFVHVEYEMSSNVTFYESYPTDQKLVYF